MTADRDFLFWLRNRLVIHYGEDENVDFVHKLQGIAYNTYPGYHTWPRSRTQKEERFQAFMVVRPGTAQAEWVIWDFINRKELMRLENGESAGTVVSTLNLFHRCNEDLAAKLSREEEEDRNIPY